MPHPKPDPTAGISASPVNDSMLADPVLTALSEALRGIRYGTVTVVIQDGRVIQIERMERKRLKPGSESSS